MGYCGWGIMGACVQGQQADNPSPHPERRRENLEFKRKPGQSAAKKFLLCEILRGKIDAQRAFSRRFKGV